MSFFNKVLRSWWVILSCIFMINGFGFLYIGFKHNNKNWIVEGIMYEIPWIFSIFLIDNILVSDPLIALAIIIMIVSIVRSIWVAIKLADIYDNEEKYTVRPTAIRNHDEPKDKDVSNASLGCCLCIIAIFVLFVLVEFILA